jgi:hypothetical protein
MNFIPSSAVCRFWFKGDSKKENDEFLEGFFHTWFASTTDFIASQGQPGGSRPRYNAAL